MPWKKLLENERYFPNQLLPTSAIIAFLEEWWDGQKTGNPCIEAVISDWCSLKPDRVLDSELDSIIKKMIKKCCQSPGSDDVVEELLSDVESLKGGKLMLKLFTIKLELLRDRALFFSKWVPESVATCAIMYYSNRLREALEDLMASSKVVHN